MENWTVLHYIAAILLTPTTLCYHHGPRPAQPGVSRSQHQRHTETYEYKWQASGGATGNVTSLDRHIKTRMDPKESKPVLRDSIVFPTDESPPAPAPTAGAPRFVPHVSEDCKKGKTLCLDVPNYPTDYIDSLISNLAEEWQPTTDELMREDVKINQRIGEDPEEFELCDYNETVVYPKAAENKDSKWLTIINTPRHVQGFRIEVCRKKESKCNQLASFPIAMTSYCKQKYMLRQMSAIDSHGQITQDYFKIPSCCVCVVKYTTNK